MTRMIGFALATLVLGGCAVYAEPPGVGVGVYAPAPSVYVAPGPVYVGHPYYHHYYDGHRYWHARRDWQGR